MSRTAIFGLSLPLLACCTLYLPARAQSSLDELERRLEDLPEPAAAPRAPGYLGLTADDSLPGGGVRVTGVHDGSPAATAGIQRGDEILTIGGVEVRNLDQLGRALDGLQAGAILDVQLRRGTRATATRVTLGRRPGASPASVPEARPSLGVKVVPLTADARARYGLAVATGALVASVEDGSPAAIAGVMPGSAIVAIDGRRIDDPNELAFSVASMRVGQETELAYYVGDVLYRKTARLAAATPAPAEPPLPDRREAAKPAASGALAEELAELRRAASEMQAHLVELERRIAGLEARISAEEKK
jgi:S1-C subfamily serine protease